jgi:uncharacterized membrane protein YphA (DoxX/SURF4 family)
MERILKILFNISRIALGLVFIFSGFVKGVDPLGSAYKFSEYFMSAGLPELSTISLIFSFLLSGAEFLIGVALVTGIFKNLTAWTALFFMGFFTILTFILAVFNPVTDCGCFGDAIKLTNWETFFKNIIFFALIWFIFKRRKYFKYRNPLWMEWTTLVLTITFYFWISIYSYRHLPLIDFMPYRLGVNISDDMNFPPGAAKDEYETIMLYKNLKTGDIKEFTLKNYPWKDTLMWKWVDTKPVLIKEGYKPPIHDFAISSPDKGDITNEILSDSGTVFLFIAYDLNESNPVGFEAAENLSMYCNTSGNAKLYAVTASSASDIQKAQKKYRFGFSFCTADETALKTMIRANPGLIVIKQGTIIGKWHYNDMKQVSLNSTNLFSDSLKKVSKLGERYLSYAVLLGFGMFLTLIWAVSLYSMKSKS